MRPIRLTLQAFGPFAGREVIDFSSALNEGLFGIYGPTGAGKTSIFDGLSFALFGESAGKERLGKSMRSDYAAKDLLTEVELVFDLGQRRYVVLRTPEQMRPTKRGNKLTSEKHKAYLFDATGMALDAITPDHRGKPLAENKVSLVEMELKDLLGYDAAQFRQIVLLPQGKFRDILTGTTEERSTILRRLFDVSLYERMTQRFRERADIMHKGIAQHQEKRQFLLEEQGFETIDALQEGVKEAGEKHQSLIAAQAAAHMAFQAGEKRLKDAEDLVALLSERADVEKTVQDLTAKQADITALQAQLVQIEAAARIAPHQAHADTAEMRKKQAEMTRAKCLKAEEGATNALAAADQALKAEQKQEPERTALQSALDALVLGGKALEKAASLQQETLSLQQKRDGVAGQLQKDNKELVATQGIVSQLKDAVQAARLRDETLRTLQEQQRHLAKESEQWQRIGEQEQSCRMAEAAFAQHDERMQEAVAGAASAQEALEKAEADLAHVQALHLARKLIDDQPCPVCGGVDHPAPASGVPESRGLNEAFEVARTRASKAEQALRTAGQAHAAAKAVLAEKQKQAAETAQPSRSKEAVQAMLAENAAEQMVLKAKPDENTMREKLEAAEHAASQHQARMEERRQEQSRLERDMAAASARFESALAAVPPAFRGETDLNEDLDAHLVALRARYRDMKADLQAGKEALQKMEERERAASLHHAEAKKEREAAEREHGERSEEAESAVKAYRAALAESALNQADYQAVKPHIGAIATYRQQIIDHQQALGTALDHRARLTVKIGKAEKPDLDGLKADLDAARTTYEAARQDEILQRKALETLAGTQKRVTAMSAEIAAEEEAYKPLGDLARMFAGNNEPRVALTEFAIAAMFDDVLAAANMRLQPMTDDRFQLQRQVMEEGGRRKRGLDIVVYDAYTETLRPTQTLSGGEGFQAALALALGLSDVVQENAGGIKLDAIFVDEGFGSLDADALDAALETLRTLVGEQRAVGVISHLDQVKDMIPAGFDIEKTPAGSAIRQRLPRA